MKNKDIFEGLNKQQLEAVKHGNSPVLVIAGAGSGKTRVITLRIVNLIKQGVPGKEILAVTFTNKAASEMKTRILRYVEDDVTVGTFHSVCLRILRRDGRHIGLRSGFTIYDDQDQLSIIKRCLKELNIDEKAVNPKFIKEKISQCKDRLIPSDNMSSEDIFVAPHFDDIYKLYEEKLNKNNGVDFGDLIAKTIYLFRKNSEVLDKYRSKFKNILVDEYQDTNYAQHEFICMLSKKHQNIMVVGDPDQSIYEWRSADVENILKFDKIFKGAETIRLEQNYRSTNTILEAANAIISNNVNRKPKELWSDNGKGELIDFFKAQDARMEAAYLVNKLLEYRNQGSSLKDMAGFYRTHAQSRVIEEELIRNNIPYKIVGGVKFYARKEIKDLLAYLKLTRNSSDDVSFLRIINTPRRGIGKAAIEKMSSFAKAKGISLFDAVKELSGEKDSKKTLSKFCSMMSEFKGKSTILPLDKLLELIIERTGYVDILESENTTESKARIENIGEFYESILEFQNSLSIDQENALDAYLESIVLQTDIDGHQGYDNQFTLMTLHSAKGLEFPIVFMLGMEEGILPHANSISSSESELEEERRLCYVGLTRAMERLHLSYAQERKIFGFSKYQNPSRFLSEIPPRLINSPITSSRAKHNLPTFGNFEDVWES
ncbi:MAG: UvrD-helicase domain-containing protein [Candidatus Zapsychrus exili]|nr:UvrD-helicase domain-containing protein [Candidatus Zapsychrus exili]